MGHRRSQTATETNSKVEKALAGLSSGEYGTPYQAAKALGLSESTLHRRIRGGKSRAEAREGQQILSKAEEKALEGWITRLTATGHPASHDFIQEMAEEIRKGRHRDDEHPHTYTDIGSSWVQCFIKRHPHLKTSLSRSIEAARIKDVTKDVIVEWFAKLQETMEEHQITLENTYNMDETGTQFIHYAHVRIFNWNKSNSIHCG